SGASPLLLLGPVLSQSRKVAIDRDCCSPSTRIRWPEGRRDAGRLHSPHESARHGVGTLLVRVTAIRRDRATRHGPVAGRDCSLACRPSRASTGPNVPYGGLEPMAAKLIAFDEEARR